MRVAVNIEFTGEEIVKHAEDLARRVGVNFFLDAYKIGRRIDPTVVSALGRAFVEGVARAGKDQAPPESPPSAPVAVGVRPLDRCARVGEHPECVLDEGWECCRCHTYNGESRTACRTCKHERCDFIVTPPPQDPESSST